MPSVSVPIIDQLVHPSIGLLTRVAHASNPFSGFVSVAPPQNPLVALTYGVVLRINTVGAFHGRDVSFPVQYTPRLGKIACEYVDLSGLIMERQVEAWTFDNQNYFWDEPLPSLFNVYLSPDVTLNLFWLQT